MALSKIEQVTRLLKGSHVMGDTPNTGLAAYHDAKACVNAMRRVGWERRFTIIRQHTKNYRVMVSLNDNGIRIYRPDTQQEMILSI
jgi:hypothetical protein